MRIHALSALAVALLVAASAAATHADCEPTTSDAEIDVAGTFYVDEDSCGGVRMGPAEEAFDALVRLIEEHDPLRPTHECLFSIWIYQESNGIAGLQRGDEIKDDTCGGQIEPDTIIF